MLGGTVIQRFPFACAAPASRRFDLALRNGSFLACVRFLNQQFNRKAPFCHVFLLGWHGPPAAHPGLTRLHSWRVLGSCKEGARKGVCRIALRCDGEPHVCQGRSNSAPCKPAAPLILCKWRKKTERDTALSMRPNLVVSIGLCTGTICN